ncbi:hypothetical protein EH230_05960 [Flavobacterium columnare]|uniref:Lipoprotein n=1 Tax=Flavobacterium columnare TaxID=996 RepID=A0A437UA29_9FLAO|nr:hypothetical protein [Flavobacterium columnare]RVU90480.1 hypothetical protein EH230_05960 [Flavobacterium columnare]
MKNIFFLIALILCSCSPSIKDNYTGYIYLNKKPLKRAKIIEENTENYTFSDRKGFFILKRQNLHSVNNLIFEISDTKDTIELLRGGGAGKNTHYYFLNKNIDTVDLHLERIFKNQTKGK